MKNNLKKVTFLFLSAVLLSACNLPGVNNKVDTDLDVKSNTEVITPEITTSPTPTLSKDNSVDSIEADLNSTLILEEDFSDL